MDKPSLNFSKKLAQPNDVYLVVGDADKKIIYKKTHIYIKKIIPNRVIMNKNVYRITYISKMYHMDGFEISTENDKVSNIRIFGFHPNCDPETDIFCLPDFKKDVHLTDNYLNLIMSNIQTYYLDTCFFNPIGKNLRYEKMKSIYIQLNG